MTRNPARVVVLILVLLGPAFLARCGKPPLHALPDIPEALLSGMEDDVREQVQRAYQTALDTPSEAPPAGRIGMLLHAYGYYETAARFYAHALALAPSSFQWTYDLGLAREGAGQKEAAAALFQTALALRPDDVPARLHLASALIDLNRAKESLPHLREVVRRQPGNALAHFDLGRALAAQHRTEEAVSSLARACRLAPDFGAAHYALALAYREQGQPDAAQRHAILFEQHRDTRPPADDPLYREIRQLRAGVSVLLERGRRLQEEERYEEAIQAYRQVLQVRPEQGMAHASLMGLYRHLGRLSEGEAQYRTALGVNPDIPEIHYNYGLLLLDRGQSQEAVRAFEQALELNPSYADARANLAVLLAASGHTSRAVSHLRQALETDPNHRLARYNLARLLLEDGKSTESIDLLLGAAAGDDRETTEIEALLTTALALAGRWPEAEEHGRRALDLAGKHGQEALARTARVDLGRILARRGQTGEAIDLLVSASRSADPDNAETPALFLLLASCYSRAGDPDEAVKQARRALVLARRQGQQELISTIEGILASPGGNQP